MQWMLMQNAGMEWYRQSYPLFEKVDVKKQQQKAYFCWLLSVILFLNLIYFITYIRGFMFRSVLTVTLCSSFYRGGAQRTQHV